ncbi:chemotaxis protein CheB [Allokutzneria oryzae]|uniref:protein-glutamate methylesterase n=1 Tax=Allokutzneria oryzae TaxID=1378989 RepID=A0ABV5ZPU0_9PSEU
MESLRQEARRAKGGGIVAIAASAGGIVALGRVLARLPAEFAVPVVIVQHLDPRHDTVIAEVLERSATMTVKLAEDNERAAPGTIYVAPPNRHLLVGRGGLLTLSTREPLHFHRPSADLLFESVATAYGSAAVACVLTGTGDDGAAGVRAVKSRGGTVIAEDPGSAEFNGMPVAAINTGAVDFVLPLGEISAVLSDVVKAGSS